jgi:hypothetical protein
MKPGLKVTLFPMGNADYQPKAVEDYQVRLKKLEFFT